MQSKTRDLESSMKKEGWKPFKDSMWVVLPAAATVAVTGVGVLGAAITVTAALARAAYKSMDGRAESTNPYAYAVAIKQLREPPSGTKGWISNELHQWLSRH